MSEVICVFPGQGSQSIGMMSELYASYANVREVYDEASDALGYDIWQLTKDGPLEALNQTTNTQPALLVAGFAAWKALTSQADFNAKFFAGHSLGEYTALVAAGSISLSDAVKLVAKRGEFMQEAVPAGVGAMAAILGLEDDVVENICVNQANGDVLSAVNYNSPGQVVIAGNKAAVERACVAAKEAKARRAMVLPVSVPSHCALMKPAADKLASLLATVSVSEYSTPVIHNADVAICATSADIKAALVKQLYAPVRWVESMRLAHSEGVATFVECGPGKVLAGLNKRIIKGSTQCTVFDQASLDKTLELVAAVDA